MLLRRTFTIAFAFLLILVITGCGGSSVATPSGNSVAVSLSAPASSLQVGQSMQLTASVANAANTALIWEVNGITGGDSTVGAITANGLYTAPSVPPSPAVVVITVAAAADTSASQSVNVTITGAPAPVTVAVSPKTASVRIGSAQQFSAVVSNATDTSVTWQVNGVQGGDTVSGTITNLGEYTAPTSVPSGGTVTIEAVSNADASAADTATVTITPTPTIMVVVSPSMATLQTSTTQSFTAAVNNSGDQGVTWQVNGAQGGNPTVGTITADGVYSAPAAVPNPATVTVTATAHADATVQGAATVTIQSGPVGIAVAVSPKSANVRVNGFLQFTASVTNAGDPSVTWSVNNKVGGDTTTGTISTTGGYTAPAVVPASAVTVTATSNADHSKSDSASVTIDPGISVTVMPSSISLIVNQMQKFSAHVSNTADQGVVWGFSGAACSTPGVCGSIGQDGTYMAPGAVPSPDPHVVVTATAHADGTKIGSATVTVTVMPTPTVTISPSGIVNLPFTAPTVTPQTFSATVAPDATPALGVSWTLICVLDGETAVAPYPDCVNDRDNDAATEAFTLSNMSQNSVTLNTAKAGDGTHGTYEVCLIATSVATGTDGTHGRAIVDIAVPADAPHTVGCANLTP